MSDIRVFEIYRYDPDVDAAPRMERYELELTGERMLLDALIYFTVSLGLCAWWHYCSK